MVVNDEIKSIFSVIFDNEFQFPPSWSLLIVAIENKHFYVGCVLS